MIVLVAQWERGYGLLVPGRLYVVTNNLRELRAALERVCASGVLDGRDRKSVAKLHLDSLGHDDETRWLQ